MKTYLNADFELIKTPKKQKNAQRFIICGCPTMTS